MKKAISMLACIAMVFAMFTVTSFASYTNLAVSGDAELSAGDEFTVTISVDAFTASGYAAKVKFDNSKFEVTGLAGANASFPQYIFLTNTGNPMSPYVYSQSESTVDTANESGIYSWVYGGQSDINFAAGTLVTISMKVKDGATGSGSFVLSEDYTNTSEGNVVTANVSTVTKTIKGAETVTVTTASRADKKVTWNVAVTASLMQAGKVSAKAYVPNTEHSDTTDLSWTDTVLTAITGNGVATFNVFTTLDTDTYLNTTELEVTANGVTGSSAN